MIMGWIENVSLANIEKGFHFDAGPNSMLIQIVDPDMEFPTPRCEFSQVFKFRFLDIEEDHEWAITEPQARELVKLLHHAVQNSMNVIVHCHAGVCRSGAVAEVGVMMGLQDTEVFRSPNLKVKSMMIREWQKNDIK